jgi:hypothetical protein
MPEYGKCGLAWHKCRFPILVKTFPPVPLSINGIYYEDESDTWVLMKTFGYIPLRQI